MMYGYCFSAQAVLTFLKTQDRKRLASRSVCVHFHAQLIEAGVKLGRLALTHNEHVNGLQLATSLSLCVPNGAGKEKQLSIHREYLNPCEFQVSKIKLKITHLRADLCYKLKLVSYHLSPKNSGDCTLIRGAACREL